MKKLKTMMALIMCLILTLSTFGQEKYTFYDNIYSGNRYDIEIESKDTTKYKTRYSLYIYMMSLDKLSKSGGIMVGEKGHDEFVTTLIEAQDKYNEWVKTAEENNVLEIDKTMSLKTRVSGYFLYGTKWNLVSIIDLTFDFKIINGKNLLIVRTNRMASSSNKFMTHDGFVFVFSSTEEITEFLDIISKNKIIEFIGKPKNTDLFK